MQGREKNLAAFSAAGTPEFAAAICYYEDIYCRDHADSISSHPWWWQLDSSVERQVAWRREMLARSGQDWVQLPPCASREERASQAVEEDAEGVWRVDRRTGRREPIRKPPAGGETIPIDEPGRAVQDDVFETPEAVDEVIGQPPSGAADGDAPIYAGAPVAPISCPDGGDDLAKALLAEFSSSHFPVLMTSSPLWTCWRLWGFQGLMLMIRWRIDLVERACRRLLAWQIDHARRLAGLGVEGVWIEECFTGIISPADYARLNVPFVRELVETIRALGMKSIHYFTGNPAGKLDLILAIGADALAFEESKKGYAIDLRELVDAVRGRVALLGNLDAVAVLQDGTEEVLHAEIRRQLGEGRRNRSRFIMSLGSPITPRTPIERVKLYCDLVHEYSNSI